MRQSWIAVAVCALVFMGAEYLDAQRSGGGGRSGSGNAQGQGQGQISGQQGMGGMGQQQTMRDQQQMRVRSLATQQQRTSVRQTLSATRQLRSQLRPMTKLGKGQQIGAEQAKQWREQIRNQLRLMQQQQQEFVAGLTDEQQAFVEGDLQQMNDANASMVDFVEDLEAALEQDEIDEATVKEDAKKVDSKAKKVESEQNQIMSELGLI